MQNGPSSHDLFKTRQLRRYIMESLYHFFTEYPYAAMEMSQLHESCGNDAKSLNWNIVYLEKSGYVELSRSVDCPPYVSCSASITGSGVDLVENESDFNAKFPIAESASPSGESES